MFGYAAIIAGTIGAVTSAAANAAVTEKPPENDAAQHDDGMGRLMLFAILFDMAMYAILIGFVGWILLRLS